ncbi:uncharacterized protein [Dendrobates tinctorius]|uniref:uncharacterized protein isoform X4 n=1 Tax=Dendrobates tinctorius TaxID=92724 RepID=UPI003CC9C8D8
MCPGGTLQSYLCKKRAGIENCQSPNILHAVHSGNFLRLRIQLDIDMIAQVRYREITSAQWHIINVTHLEANISLPEALLQETYIMQQRCFKEFCFHCKWESETIVPHELLGAPDITVTIEKLSPGKQRLTIEWKYAGHNYVDGYLVVIQRLPDSCRYTIAFNTTNTRERLNLSVSFFNVSVMAHNKAGRSRSASTVVPPLDAPEFPGKIIATYENNTIFLSWSPLFECDFVVINWGTSYLQMESKIIMDKIENYSIPDTFLNASSKRHYQIEGLTGGHTYEVTVSGVTVTGAGAPSAPQTIQTLSYDEAELRIIVIVTCAGLVITVVLLVRGFAYTVHRAKKRYIQEIPNPKHSHIFKTNEAASRKTLFLASSSFDEEKSCFDQLGVEVTQQSDSLPAETSVWEMNNSVLLKTSKHHKTSHAYAVKEHDYTHMMAALKVFQRMREDSSYLQQQPTAVEK